MDKSRRKRAKLVPESYIIHDLATEGIVKSRFASKSDGEAGCFVRSGREYE